MSKDTYYFTHDYNSRNDIKIRKLLSKHGMVGYGIFWVIVEELYNNANVHPLDYDCLAYDLRTDVAIIKSIVEDFDLFVINNNEFGSRSIERRLSERNNKSVKARQNALKKWGITGDSEIVYSSKRSERMADARKKGRHTKVEWENMREFFGECLKCGSQTDILKDHITPIYQGGSDGIDNIQPLCRTCNASKGSESKDYRPLFCLQNACKMPANFKEMPAIKERKGKERKEKERKEKEKAKDEEKIIFPFDSQKFLEAWEIWKRYKLEQHNFKYKGIISEQSALKKLSELSDNNESEAIKLIHDAISRAWKGIYKISENGKSKQSGSESTADRYQDLADSIDRMFKGKG